MTHPRRAIDYTPRTPRRRWPALAAAGVLLTSGGIGAAVSLPAQADTHETPSTAPSATVAAEPGPVCGTVTVAVTGDYLELYRAALDTATESPDWVRLAPLDRTTHTRTDTPGSPFAQYRVLGVGTDEDQSPVVEVEPCPEETPTPTPTPTPTATPSGSVAPTPSATPTAPGTPAPTGAAIGSPGADADKSTGGGLAKTGV